MKDLNEYLNEQLNEGLKDNLKNLISKFRRKQEKDIRTRNMEDARLAFYNMTKNSQGIVSASEVIHIIKDIRMKFKDADYMFGSGNDDTRGFLQGFLDYGWMNYKNTIMQDPFGERSCDATFNRCIDQTNDRGVGLSCLGRFFYGWSFAKELNLKISSHWMVDWNSDDPFKIVDVR